MIKKVDSENVEPIAEPIVDNSDNKDTKKKRNEAQGILNFSKEMLSAFATAIIFIIYVIQAFKIPTGSMEKTEMVGDMLLGLKFVYGAPIIPDLSSLPIINQFPVPTSYLKFPGITKPHRGDVIIFKFPGKDKKDYIKRCVAIAGDSIKINRRNIIVNGITLVPPPKSQYTKDGKNGDFAKVENFPALYIPKKGDTLKISEAPIREFMFYKHLIHQEHPRKTVEEKFKLYIDGEEKTDKKVILSNGQTFVFTQEFFKPLDTLGNWALYDNTMNGISKILEGYDFEIKKELFLDGKRIDTYVTKWDNYFMMGDNRDNSFDSRYWGFVNKNFIKAQAIITYMSFDKDVPWYLLPAKIRWNRLGQLIRRWDGKPKGVKTLDPK